MKKSILILPQVMFKCSLGRFLAKAMSVFSLLLVFTAAPTMAQGIAGGAQSIANTLITVANILFPAMAVIGVLITVVLALTQNPGWKRAFFFALVAFAVWGGYDTYKDEIFGYFGGSDTIGTTAPAAG